MKTIGIKLADGSFYPVLEDNTPSEKKLELTTAHNNQTKVMVDLYRSASCSMEDAEYVDSLQIENMNAHPNGEPDIKFTVSLDEDNQLSAKIVDSETGNESNTSITLVSRTLEERLVTDEYDINDSKDADKKGAAVAAGALAAGGLLAAAAALRDKEDAKNEVVESAETSEVVEAESETEIEIESESEPAPEPFAEDAELEVETIEEEAPLEDETFVEQPVEEEAFSEEAVIDEKPLDDDFITEDEPVFDEAPLEEPADDIVIDDAVAEDDTEFEQAPAEETSIEESENTEDIASELSDMDFDLPDESDNTVVESVENSEEKPLPDMDFDLPDESDDTVVESAETTEDEPLPDMDFDLPDESDNTVAEPVETTEELTASDDTISADDTITDDNTLPDMDFDLPDDTNDEPEMPADFFNTDDLDNNDNLNDTDNLEDTMNDPLFDTDTPAAGGLNFDGLYDEETERGTPAQNDEDDVKKKTKVPVIICIICAIICIIATLLILFIIPSKYNLITKKHSKEVVAIEAPAPEPAPAPLAKVEPVPEPEPAVPEAKEDEVIIIEKAEEVVPAQPPVAEEKPKNITYKIKWGDTLWDIADTYYKNPWRYKYIARYNGIKNPDYIISGTIITIPAL